MSIISYRFCFALWLCIAVAGCVSNDPAPTGAGLVTDRTFGRYHENLEPGLIVITMTPERQASLIGPEPVPIGGELPPRYAAFLERLDARYGLKRVANWPLATIDVFCVVFEVRDPSLREAVVVALREEPGVETAQVVQTFGPLSREYNDPYLSMQHAVRSIQAISSHRWSRGRGVRIAIIDTGLDDTHPDLASSTESTMNFVDDDESRFRADTHGTAVGGVIAADTDNAAGMVGVAPDADLLALKACWHLAEDSREARCNSLTLAKALNHSIQQDVDVINLSLTGPPDALLERLVLEALARDIVVVGARPSHDREAFPVSVEGTIAVAMPDVDSRAVSAPGRGVLSTRPAERYDFFSGSSFSTAHISGLAALVRSLSPSLTPSGLLTLIERTADPETGVVNACRAVEMARRWNDERLGGDSDCERER